MAHINVNRWDGKGKRPCDWCGKRLDKEGYIHAACEQQESRFYTQLGYDGESDIKLPNGYQIVIPRGQGAKRSSREL